MPVSLNVVLLVVGSSLFYTYVGQLVPQKQLLPPAEVAIAADLTLRSRSPRCTQTATP